MKNSSVSYEVLLMWYVLNLGRKDSYTREKVPERTTRVYISSRPEWKVRTRTTTQRSTTQGS